MLTHRGEDLSEAARVHYDRAMGEADSRDWEFQAEEWRRAREKAERWLWAVRA